MSGLRQRPPAGQQDTPGTPELPESGREAEGPELTILDDARLRRRRRLIMGSVPAALAVAVIALKLLSMPISAGQAQGAFADGDGAGTLGAGSAMGFMNMVERWKAPFARGDGHALMGDFATARSEFAAALEQVAGDQSCKVRVNLVLSIEKLGDERQAAGDTQAAQELFTEGRDVIAAAPQGCFVPESPGNSQGEGDALRDADERLAQKQHGDTGENQQPAPSEDEGEPAESAPNNKLEQLEKNAQEAQKQRDRGQKLSETFSDEQPEQYGKPW